MCRCRTVSVHSLALSSSMSNRFQALRQAPSWRASSPAKSGAAWRRQRASWPALGDRAVAGGVEGDDLLHGRRPPLLQLDGELVGDEPGLLDQPPVDLDDLAVAQQPGAGGEGDPHVRLVGLHLQIDRLGVDLAWPSTVRWRPFRSR